jgi:hypothetical protein
MGIMMYNSQRVVVGSTIYNYVLNIGIILLRNTF